MTNQWDSEKALNLSGVLVTALVGGLGIYSMSDTPYFGLTAFLATAQVLLFTFWLKLSDYAPWRVLFWLEAICIASLQFIVPDAFILILTLVWLVQSVELYGIRTTIWFLLGSLALSVTTQLFHLGTEYILSIVLSIALYSLLQLFAVSVTHRFANEREEKKKSEALNRELIATRKLLSQSAAQGERLRIARDLHDILGHHMTALILNLEVASHSAEPPAQEKVNQSLALAKLLLGDLRSTVSELREETVIDLEQSVQQLVAGIPNIDVSVDFSSAPEIEDVELAEILLRCAQEAITNVLRHSNASQCHISLSEHENQCVLVISDNGSPALDIEPGNGLKGMAERLKVRGGQLAWQISPTGFELKATLDSGSAT